VNKGDVLVVKSSKIPNPQGQYLYKDKSVIYRQNEPAVVERIIVSTEDGAKFAKIKLRSDRPIREGDKLCFDKDTELLTEFGWINISKITQSTHVATLDPSTKYLSYQLPTALYSYKINEHMYCVNGPRLNMKVTANHKLYASPDGRSNTFDLTEVCDAYQSGYYHTGANQGYYPEQRTIDWDELKLMICGAWITSGYLTDDPSEIIIPYCIYRNELAAQSTEFNNDISAAWNSKGSCIVKYKQMRDDLMNWCVVSNTSNTTSTNDQPQYKTLRNLIPGLDHKQTYTLLSNIMIFNGYIKGSLCTIYADTRQIADDISILAAHCGFQAVVSTINTYAKLGNGYAQSRSIDALLDQPIVKYVCDIYHYEQTDLSKTSSDPCDPKHTIHSIHPDSICVVSPDYTESMQWYNNWVYCVEVPNHIVYARRYGKPYWSGNSSREGCKGIVSAIVDQHEMPYTEDGIIPDIIVNSHSIPTRMVIGQLKETGEGELAVRQGTFRDATAFRTNDMRDNVKMLEEKFGVPYAGHRRMYNGRLGTWYDTLIFIGLVSYQRLQKFVLDEHYAINNGPTCNLTHQPLDGKQKDGGLRFGEMEKDVLAAHGAMRMLHTKMYKDSDGVKKWICRNCGQSAVYNQQYGIYKCKKCKDNACIVEVSSAWAANNLESIMRAMNIQPTYESDPFGYVVDTNQ
jgi:ribosomal protein L37AE/L43A